MRERQDYVDGLAVMGGVNDAPAPGAAAAGMDGGSQHAVISQLHNLVQRYNSRRAGNQPPAAVIRAVHLTPHNAATYFRRHRARLLADLAAAGGGDGGGGRAETVVMLPTVARDKWCLAVVRPRERRCRVYSAVGHMPHWHFAAGAAAKCITELLGMREPFTFSYVSLTEFVPPHWASSMYILWAAAVHLNRAIRARTFDVGADIV